MNICSLICFCRFVFSHPCRQKPEVTHIWLEKEFSSKGIEEDIKETLLKQNQ